MASWQHASGSEETQSRLARRARGTSAPARRHCHHQPTRHRARHPGRRSSSIELAGHDDELQGLHATQRRAMDQRHTGCPALVGHPAQLLQTTDKRRVRHDGFGCVCCCTCCSIAPLMWYWMHAIAVGVGLAVRLRFLRGRLHHFGNRVPWRAVPPALPCAVSSCIVWLQLSAYTSIVFHGLVGSSSIAPVRALPAVAVAFVVLEDELLRQRAVATTPNIAAYRLEEMMGTGSNGAVARMTFTRSREASVAVPPAPTPALQALYLHPSVGYPLLFHPLPTLSPIRRASCVLTVARCMFFSTVERSVRGQDAVQHGQQGVHCPSIGARR
jgi:hypothetical protein